jgi:glutamate-1-semialdehyde 2,1-aminomutase
VTCGLKTLELVSAKNFYMNLTARTKQLVEGMQKAATKFSVPFCSDYEGGMFGFFFQKGPVRNFEDAKRSNVPMFKKFFWGMLENGVYMAPSAYEAGFVSSSHSEQDIEDTLAVCHKVLGEVSK